MDITAEELKAVVERDKIRHCIARVARGEDRRDAAALRACYWPDASVDFGIFSGDFEKYLAWVVPGSPAVLLTQHVLGQSVIDVRSEAALAESHVLAYHRISLGKEQQDMLIGGRYLDRLEERGATWRIAKRTMLYDWYQELGRSVDWSSGLMGARFSGPHFTGRASGDFSLAFFGVANATDANPNPT